MSNVRRLLKGILGPDADIDDLVQDVFIQVFQSINAFRGDSRFSTWLHRVASNMALSWLRKKKRLPMHLSDSHYPMSPETQSDTVQRQSEIQALYGILDTLSPRRRIAFILFEIEQYTLSEIADMTGSNVATVKSRLFFGRREILKKAHGSPVLRELISAPEKGGAS
ncbi:MAG: RNA polymerase sigma factor [Deltaproteobacteria bacterium]|nr:RNA polymerase sigma factor [Deltaproteobacteria bacterium]